MEFRFEDTIKRLNEMGTEFLTISATRGNDGELFIAYYFRQESRMLVVKVNIKDNTMPSLYSTFSKSDFIEREISNIFGVKFIGHPNLERIKTQTEESREEIYEV